MKNIYTYIRYLMEEINKKIRGNASISYFMVLISISFLFSKDPNVSHPFVKSHVKSAFTLHLLLIWVFIVMSYPFLESVRFVGYSLNSIITAVLAIGLFAGILYGMYMASSGKEITLWEIFYKVWVSKKMTRLESSQMNDDDIKAKLITAHIPFIGYMMSYENKNIPHMRDVIKLNFLLVCISVIIFILGYTSLSSMLILGYTIWSVFVGTRLVLDNHITTPNLEYIPNVEEKYILQKSIYSYIKQTLAWAKDISFEKIQKEQQNKRALSIKNELSISQSWKSIFIKNSVILFLLFIICAAVFGLQSKILLLFLFPASYLIGYKSMDWYMLPYIYDIYILFRTIKNKIRSIFSATRRMQKTEIKETVTIWETKKES